MSLLNKMLRDLDARRAPSLDRAALPDDVHVTSADGKRTRSGAVLVLALLAAVGWYWIGPDPAPVQRIAAVIPEPRPVPAAPVAVPAPAVAPVTPAPVTPAPVTPAPVTPAPVTPAPVTPAPSPAVPVPAVPVPPAPEPRASAPAQAAAPAVPVHPATPPAAAKSKKDVADAARPEAKKAAPIAPVLARPPAKDAKEAPPAEEPSGIEKRPRGALAGGAAENEYGKAMAALRQGGTSTALQGLRTALRLDARHVSARQALLSLLLEQQQWSEAEALLEEGLALDPAQNGWALALARLQLEKGRLAAAADTLERHSRHAEQNGDYQAFRALLFQKQKRPAEAAERYRAALALKPAEARWWYGLGLVLEADHKTHEAREAYLKAREAGNLPPDVASAVEHRLR